MVPGFGVTGIAGIIAVAVALTGVMTTSDAVTGIDDLGAILRSVGIVAIGAAAAAALVLYLTSSRGPKVFRRHTELMTELTVDKGFIGVDLSPRQYIGAVATTLTEMRPAGKIQIGNETFDAVSTGEFIGRRHKVQVVRYENAQLYVTLIE